VQKTTPTATGIEARGGKVFITHSKAPKAQERTKLQQLLTDASKLRTLKEPVVVRKAAKQKDVKETLLDESTPDAEWLQAFRRYAVDTLLKER
jgi:hypothetical protein